jgi:hypothetical protein
MSRVERLANQRKPFYKMWSLYFIIAVITLLLSTYFYSKSLIKIKSPKQVLGEKVIITLPEGKTVYTFENLIIEEDGKLYYKGERNTLDLTGGQIVYENWK